MFNKRLLALFAAALWVGWAINASSVGLVTQSGPRHFSSSSSSSSGGGSPGYTATHYVTTGASGSGDGSIGNPWTIAQAVANATGSNKVQIATGVYNVTVANSNLPVLSIANSGTSAADPLVFFCALPGAYNRATPANQCEIRGNNPAVLQPVIGIVGGQDNIVIDGLTFNETYTSPRPSSGIIKIGGGQSGPESTDVSLRRLYVVMTQQPSGDNYSAIVGHYLTNFTLTDSWFEGGSGDGEGDAVTMYGCWNFLIEHNTLDGTRMGFYAKGSVNGATRWNYGVMRLNYAEDVDNKVFFVSEVQTAQNVDIYQNICRRSHACVRGDPAGVGPSRARAYNNTIVDSILDPVGSGNGAAMIWFDGATPGTDNAAYNNIIANFSTVTNVALVTAQVSAAAAYFSPINYNVYYNNGSTLYFATNQDDVLPGDGIQLSAWRAAVSDEANSQGVNPSFVNATTGDYHLNGGSPALTAGNTGGPVGAYITGTEEIGIRASPTY